MTRVLVTGASGFVGKPLCRDLVRAGFRVSATTRNPRRVDDLHGVEVRPVAGLGAGTDWSGALRGVDMVVHLAARVHVMKDESDDPLAAFRRVNAQGTAKLAVDAAAAGVRRLVMLSTIKVNGEKTEERGFTGADAVAPEDPYAKSKFEAERALFGVAGASDLQAVVIRPPLVYGPEVRGDFLSLLGLCRKAPPLPLASIRNGRSLIYVENLVSAILACLKTPAAAGGIYVVRDGEDLSTPELIRRLSAAMGRPDRLWPCPPALLRAAGAMTGRAATVARLLDSLRVDDRQIRQELDWAPPHTVDQGVAATAEWYVERFRADPEES